MKWIIKIACVSIFSLFTINSSAYPVKSNISGRNIIIQETQEQSVTAKSYVQDGLVAQWDGIENVSYGVHDETATVWTDLVNNRIYQGYNFVCEDNAVVVQGNASNIFTYSDLISEERTREIVFEPITISFSNDPMLGGTKERLNDFCIWGTRTPSLIAFYRNGQTFYTASSDGAYVITSLTVANFQNKTNGYVNGNLSKDSLTYFVQQGETIMPWYGKVRIFAFRVYNRALSDAEVKHNYKIDKVRFGL